MRRLSGLVVMWSGEFVRSDDRQEILDGLIKAPVPEGNKSYLTRLETRMDPASMTEDISFLLHPTPNEFAVRIRASETLKAVVDLSDQDNLGVTALMYAARYNQNPAVISTLLNAGARVNDRNNGRS